MATFQPLYERKPWMDAEPPVNYVAGLGRGATGFTTRSDIGPARAALPPDPITLHLRHDDDDDKQDYSESNYDEFEGYGGTLYDPAVPYEQDDKEADEMWASVDQKMDSKRKSRREARLREELAKYRQMRPKIQQTFADAKKDLATVSMEEWDNIPEIGDHTTRHIRKKPRNKFGFVPVPDSVIEKARTENENYSFVDDQQQIYGGLETPLPGTSSTVPQDMTQYGVARTQVLSLNLNKISDSVTGQTVVDPKGFLTSLASTVKLNSEAEIGDMKKARLLLQSVTQTNPKHAPGWIAAARLEEYAGKLVTARKLIQQGCAMCPESEDVWIEAARLNTPQNAKTILAKAIQHVPKSVKVWLQAASLEEEDKAKKRVLRKALESIPNSVKLWKAAIELEEPEDARIMLTRAVECVPHSVEMWLALAHLETYDNACKILNKAREMIPTDASIWITAAKLEEAHGNAEGVKAIIKRAVKSLASHGVVIDREQWLKEAEAAEKASSVLTCQAIVKETIDIGVEDEDKKRTWMEDADSCLSRGSIETARAIYAHALIVFPKKKSLWLRVAQLEKTHGTQASLDTILARAVSPDACPNTEILWLMAAKEKWNSGDIDGSRGILHNAFAANPDSEKIWLAAVKVESESNEQDRARSLLKRARERADTERVWMKSALFEREVGNTEQEKELLEQSLKKFPQFPKFWMMRGQLAERLGEVENAREIYQRGLKNCPHSIPLWICASKLEEKISPSRARSLLEKSRMLNKKDAQLWLEAIRVELRANNTKVAQNLLAKALQECPNSGVLWAEAIYMEARPQKKARSVDALKRCDNDPHVIVAVANLMWLDGKLDKARTWFNRAVTLDPDLGDAWAYFYKLEIQHGDEKSQQDIVKRCVDADPHHGEHWCQISKALENVHLKPDQILKKVVLRLPEFK